MENAGEHAFRIWLATAIEAGGASLGDTTSLLRAGGFSPTSFPAATLSDLGPVVAVSGAGNNGGDALVMARAAANLGIPVSAVLGRAELKGSAEEQHKILRAMGVAVYYWDGEQARNAISKARWLFDGVAGTGVSGSLRGASKELVGAMNESEGAVLAVDVPSGVGDQYEPGFSATRATLTVTMGLEKRALYLPAARSQAGEIRLAEPGFPRFLLKRPTRSRIVVSEDLRSLLPPVSTDAHKGKRGFLGLFAGNEGTAGAAALAALGALHAGCGLAKVHTAASVSSAVAAADPALMVAPLDPGELGAGEAEALRDGDVEELGEALTDLLERYTALCVGPGWGVSKEKQLLLNALSRSGLPTVIDADGLNNLAARESESAELPERARGDAGRFTGSVFTPHPGEAARLLGVAIGEVLREPAAAASRIARHYDATVVLKGSVTVIADPFGEEWFVDGGEPALATAGSGDVLAGVIGGLLAGGAAPVEAAVGGVLLHRDAGRRLAAESGWFVASALPEAIGRLSAQARRSG